MPDTRRATQNRADARADPVEGDADARPTLNCREISAGRRVFVEPGNGDRWLATDSAVELSDYR
ncbi:hypothetical protein [Salarchaeum japonicum]|uniref:Uncharacterized protein n=1 Tax=Salarchaeum japonicum TaxID=555573 RepID=A0AAV3T4E5_9EURY|nr:hypothetical protein [Salarchaeum japonicum]